MSVSLRTNLPGCGGPSQVGYLVKSTTSQFQFSRATPLPGLISRNFGGHTPAQASGPLQVARSPWRRHCTGLHRIQELEAEGEVADRRSKVSKKFGIRLSSVLAL